MAFGVKPVVVPWKKKNTFTLFFPVVVAANQITSKPQTTSASMFFCAHFLPLMFDVKKIIMSHTRAGITLFETYKINRETAENQTPSDIGAMERGNVIWSRGRQQARASENFKFIATIAMVAAVLVFMASRR